MGSLSKDVNGNFSYRYRGLNGKETRRGLGTKDADEAKGLKAKLDYRLKLIRQGHLPVPPGADFWHFLLRGDEKTEQDDERSIAELKAAFLKHAEQHYRRPDGTTTAELDCIRSALKLLEEIYAGLPVDDFRPLKLKEVRERMIRKGWSRGYINKSVGRIRLVFRWGVENEIVSPATLAALKAVQGLQAGRTKAKDRPPRKPVPDEHVAAVKARVRQRTRDLIDLQLLTGARIS